MLQVKHLAARTNFSVRRLDELVEKADSYCRQFILIDPAKPEKQRIVLDVQGDLRRFQDRLLRSILMPRLVPSEYSHGSIKERHIKTNIQPHLDSVFVFTTDIANFFPSVSRDRVYQLFFQRFACTPDVARICTRLCTFRHHLALGLITSPILAEQVLFDVDRRIAAACENAGLRYSRYVDDITISGRFDLKQSGFEAVVREILRDHGFKMHPQKACFGRLSDGITITKIVVKCGHPDVRREYLVELNRQLDDASNLANGREFTGPYFTRGQIAGRIQFVRWINPGRPPRILAKFNSISWNSVAWAAVSRGLVACKRRLVRVADLAD